MAGSRSPGYDLARDTLSTLYAVGSAGRGAGLAAGACLAASHLAVAVRLLGAGRRAAARAFTGAGLAGFALLVVPISCPHGAAGCSGPFSGRGELSQAAALHRDVAVAYEALFVAAVVVLAGTLLLRGDRARAAALLAGAAGSAAVAWQLRRGVLLGVWERGWLGVNSVLLVAVAARVGLPRPAPAEPGRAQVGRSERLPSEVGRTQVGRSQVGRSQVGRSQVGHPWPARGLPLACVLAAAVLLPLAIAAQPAFDLRRDLLSDLGARGAALPALGQGVVVAVGLAHAGLAVPLAARDRLVAAGAAVVAGLALLGVATAQITCPRGAAGCSGPDSGRAVPRPAVDTLHRDLVVVFELAVLVLLVAVALHLLRTERRPGLAAAVLADAALSPVLLLVQQRGVDIGWWQLSWIACTAAGVLLALSACAPPAAVSPRPAEQPAGAGPRGRGSA